MPGGKPVLAMLGFKSQGQPLQAARPRRAAVPALRARGSIACGKPRAAHSPPPTARDAARAACSALGTAPGRVPDALGWCCVAAASGAFSFWWSFSWLCQEYCVAPPRGPGPGPDCARGPPLRGPRAPEGKRGSGRPQVYTRFQLWTPASAVKSVALPAADLPWLHPEMRAQKSGLAACATARVAMGGSVRSGKARPEQLGR